MPEGLCSLCGLQHDRPYLLLPPPPPKKKQNAKSHSSLPSHSLPGPSPAWPRAESHGGLRLQEVGAAIADFVILMAMVLALVFLYLGNLEMRSINLKPHYLVYSNLKTADVRPFMAAKLGAVNESNATAHEVRPWGQRTSATENLQPGGEG